MHPNDHMFSFYVRTPSGFSVEYGWGGLLIAQLGSPPAGGRARHRVPNAVRTYVIRTSVLTS